jgi:hypothetical protein
MTYGAHVGPTPTRRALLLAAAGSTLLGACRGPEHDSARERSQAPPTDPEEHTIFDLTLDIVDRFRPVELVAPGSSRTRRGATQHLGSAPSRLRSGRAVRAVVLDVDPYRRTGRWRLASPPATASYVLVRWSARSGRLSPRGTEPAAAPACSATGSCRRQVGFGLAFAVCENQVTALVDDGEGWQPVLTERTKVSELVDLRREDVLERYAYAWGGRDVELASVRAGLFGMTGLRDPHLVQHADGSPYVVDGRVYLTWTCAGLGFFQQAHWSVWSFDAAEPRGCGWSRSCSPGATACCSATTPASWCATATAGSC